MRRRRKTPQKIQLMHTGNRRRCVGATKPDSLRVPVNRRSESFLPRKPPHKRHNPRRLKSKPTAIALECAFGLEYRLSSDLRHQLIYRRGEQVVFTDLPGIPRQSEFASLCESSLPNPAAFAR